MVPAVQALTPLIATLMIGSYLCAAMIPCEPVSALGFSMATATPATSGQDVVMDHGGHGVPQNEGLSASTGHAPSGAHDHHAMKYAPDVTGAAPHSSHSSHASHTPPLNSERRANALAPRDEGPSLVPTCLCGCSETRSTIGGQASRLGVVVPGLFLAWLEEAELPSLNTSDPMLFVEVDFEIDPVPV